MAQTSGGPMHHTQQFSSRLPSSLLQSPLRFAGILVQVPRASVPGSRRHVGGGPEVRGRGGGEARGTSALGCVLVLGEKGGALGRRKQGCTGTWGHPLGPAGATPVR